MSKKQSGNATRTFGKRAKVIPPTQQGTRSYFQANGHPSSPPFTEEDKTDISILELCYNIGSAEARKIFEESGRKFDAAAFIINSQRGLGHIWTKEEFGIIQKVTFYQNLDIKSNSGYRLFPFKCVTNEPDVIGSESEEEEMELEESSFVEEVKDKENEEEDGGFDEPTPVQPDKNAPDHGTTVTTSPWADQNEDAGDHNASSDPTELGTIDKDDEDKLDTQCSGGVFPVLEEDKIDETIQLGPGIDQRDPGFRFGAQGHITKNKSRGLAQKKVKGRKKRYPCTQGCVVTFSRKDNLQRHNAQYHVLVTE